MNSSSNAQNSSAGTAQRKNAASVPNPAVEPERLDGGIIHFDATEVRRNRMRRDAGRSIEKPAAPAPTQESVNTRERETPSGSSQPVTAAPVSAPPSIDGSDWWQRVMRDFPEQTDAAATPIPTADPVSAAASTAPPTTPPTAPPTPSVPAEPIAAANSSTHDRAELQAFLINFVVEQTGYPEEIVEMEADLEADLGIDSIKKAQMFGEIGEIYGLQPDESLSLDDFTTLDLVLDYLAKTIGVEPAVCASQPPQVGSNGRHPSVVAGATESVVTAQPAPAVAPVVVSDTAATSTNDLRSFLINFVVEQTGYPEEIVEMDADLEADLGIDSIKKAQMFGEIGEYYGLAPDEDLSLDDFPTLSHVLEYLRTHVR
ncbi:acyl carrier protein [Planctomycetes bacterium CA13]|uniref:Acyl carrier protein n=1 Tax=Novipirellula herctigrandis TaxID=2527986 RepID=A0A5C5YWN9_9BACT|nr:acyl carrier protein [Planctomycetes bacterium CA13]